MWRFVAGGVVAGAILLASPGCPGPTPAGDTGEDTEPPAPRRSCDVVVEHTAPGAGAVEIAGTFNGWTRQAMARQEGDRFALDLGPLPPGTYAFKYIVDGAWEDPPPDVPTAWDGDVENRALRVADCQQPGLSLVGAASDTPDGLTATFRFTRAADGAPLDPDAVVVTLGGRGLDALPPGAAATVHADPATGTIRVEATGLPDGKWSVRVDAADTAGRPPEDGTAFAPVWTGAYDVPDPFNRGLLYFLFTDRFRDAGGTFPAIPGTEFDGTNYLGGDLVGATDALEEGWFDDLGVASIWITPVPDNPEGAYIGLDGWHYTGYHGYWPVAARRVDEHWGTDTVPADQALRGFVDAAHARGIRILLDLPLNHVHEDHEWVEDHPGWFTATPCICTTDPGPCNWDTNPLSCWFTDYLPDLDYRNPEIVDAQLDDIQWWIETFDVDGLRLDAAKHMDHVILRSLALRLQAEYGGAEHGDFYLVGETFVGPGGQDQILAYVAPYELDGQFDFPLVRRIRDAIGHRQGFRPLAAEVRASDGAYGPFVHGMSVFMGNHDIPRYATEIAGCDTWQLFGGCPDLLAESGDLTPARWELVNALSLSFAFVATQPGPPLLYYGDEIGLAGAGDPDNRRLMIWDRSPAQDLLLARFQAIGQARATLPALQAGERIELWVDDTLYVYARAIPGGDVAIVALNIGGPVTRDVGLFGDALLPDGTLENVLNPSRTAAVADGTLTVALDPWEYAIFVPR